MRLFVLAAAAAQFSLSAIQLLWAETGDASARQSRTTAKQEDVFGAAAAGLNFIHLSQDDDATRREVLALMDRYHLPGLSIAVIDQGKIAWARGYGTIAPGGKPVTAQTRFQAGSVSKPVTAVGVLRLVEQGKLHLDGDLNQSLKSWKIPANELTTKQPVSLRQALGHTAGFNQPADGWRGYAEGEPLPTLIQMLNGEEPANSPAVVVDMVPGSTFRYSGCGYLVIQQAVVDVTGSAFPQAMDNLVLAPLEMANSTFDQPVPASISAIAALGHDNEGRPIPGGWHTYPEMAAGGLWTTAEDLARFVIAMQRAYQSEAGAILQADMIRQALTVQIPTDKFADRYGLGFQVDGKDRTLCVWHGGGTAGFDSYMIGYVNTGQGAVIMLNKKGAGEVIQELWKCIRAEYAFP